MISAQATIVFCSLLTSLTGCSYTVNYESSPLGAGVRGNNLVAYMNGTNLYIHTTNGVMLPVGASLGMVKKGDLHDSGYYDASDESETTPYFFIELLVDPIADDVNVKPSAVALRINEQTAYPDAYILADTPRSPNREAELFFWRTSSLCRDNSGLPIGSSRRSFDFASALRKIDRDTWIDFSAGKPLCLALKFSVPRPDPRTAIFTLDLSQAVVVRGEWQKTSPIQFAPFKSAGSGQIM